MKLYEKPPTSISINGTRYKIDPSFDRILETFDILRRDDWRDSVKVEYLLWLLFKNPPKKNKVQAIEKVLSVLLKPAHTQEEMRVIDFEQDAEYIYAAFRQAYGIDLLQERGRMHWWTFTALFKGLPNGTKLADIIQIRLADVPQITKHNAKTVHDLMKAKAAVKLRETDEERKQRYQEGLKKVAQVLVAMAKQKKGGGTHG